MELADKDIYISPTMKDLLRHMMEDDKDDRYSMEQVLSHKYLQDNEEDYQEVYHQWKQMKA